MFIVANNDDDGNGYKKANSRCLKLYRTYSISFSSINVGKSLWSGILKDCIKVQRKKKKLLFCVPVLDKT